MIESDSFGSVRESVHENVRRVKKTLRHLSELSVLRGSIVLSGADRRAMEPMSDFVFEANHPSSRKTTVTASGTPTTCD